MPKRSLLPPVPPGTAALPVLFCDNELATPRPAFGFGITVICPEMVTLPVARMMVPLGTVSVPVTAKVVN